MRKKVKARRPQPRTFDAAEFVEGKSKRQQSKHLNSQTASAPHRRGGRTLVRRGREVVQKNLYLSLAVAKRLGRQSLDEGRTESDLADELLGLYLEDKP